MSDNATMKNTTIHDMTTGSPARLIMQFMIPMFLGNIFQQFYNIADSIIAGQFLGVRALAAIGSTGSLMFFVTGWLNGLSSGFAILVSQWFGAKEYERMRHYVAMSIYLSAGWAVLMTIGLGGSIGLGKEVLARSDYALSFSKMTFPHQLMRVILLEQIYRSYRIINGEPYHK